MKSAQYIISGVLVLVVISILVGLYYYFNNYSVKGKITRDFLPMIHDAKMAKRVNQGAIPSSSQGNEYNINLWIYINDYVYRYNEDKVVINRGVNPAIILTSETNSLKVITEVENNLEMSEEEDENNNECILEDIPLQRWVNINISLNNKVLDIFMDGKLKKTCLLNGYPKPNIGSMDICPNGGFNGFMSNVRFTNSALSLKEINSLYRNGPSL